MGSDYFFDSSIWDFPAEPTKTTKNQETQQQEAVKKTQSDVFYKTKKIHYRGRKKLIILQNHNGPCPLIAICNVLLLRGDINLHPDTSQVSLETLVNLVGERLMIDVDNNNEEYDENQLNKISDAIELLPGLAKGILVDIRFSRIDDFVFTPELAIFELLKIPLYHGWLIDPEDLETTSAIGGKTHDELMTGLTALDTQTQKASSVQSSGERSVDFAASMITAASQFCSKTISFADSPPASAEDRSFGKRDIEEEIALLNNLTLTEREARAFDTHRDSTEEESVSGFSDEYQMSDDDTLLTSVEISEADTDCDVWNKTNLGEEVCSTTIITKSNETHDCGQLSSAELEMGDEKACDVETENSSKMTVVHVTSSEAPKSVEKINLESSKNDIISEIPLKSEAETFVNPDLSGKSQEDDVALYDPEECVGFSSPVYKGESLLGQSSSKGKDTNGLTPEEGEVIRKFLNDNATQLTWEGLFTLLNDVEENELCVLFRNNHFYTMLKREEKLYTLVTDQGYLKEQELVWERLNEINGDSVFMTGYFNIFKSKSSKSRKWDQQCAISNTTDFIFNVNSSSKEDMDIEPDLKFAMALQQELFAEDTDLEVSIIRSNRMSTSIQEVKAVLRWQTVQSCI